MTLAPMQGLTEVLFRKAYEECFPGAIESAVAPFISLTHGPLNNPAKLADVMPENNVGSIPVVPQILGKEPDEFVQVAGRLAEMGYNEVNWNMGCPMRMVTAKHRGCGLMPYPDEVRAILDSVVPRLRMRLSVKVRLGLKSADEVFSMVEVLNDYPLASVTVHPRLGHQQYTGVPDLDTFGRLLPIVRHPVVYNGDIVTPADAEMILSRFPAVSGLMVGRGVLYRPTLPLEMKGLVVDPDERIRQSKRFVAHLMEAITRSLPGEESRTRKTKEYWNLLWRSLPISELEARKALRAERLQDVEKIIAAFIQ
ncbi:MAG: tRNA-dihydrouridine synthase family protein [Bacteroidales bacterium]|nr:tRNA-dihydrouridine synthase family protein [Bacteroidales bacterium]